MSVFGTKLLLVGGAVAGEIAKSGEKAKDSVFPPFDSSSFASQLFWLALTFGLLFFLLSKVLLPRLRDILEERSNRIADDLDSAAEMQKQAEQAGRAYEKSLADARAKAHNLAESAKAKIQAELDAETAQAEAKTLKQVEEAENLIRKTRAAAMANVEEIASETAKTALEQVFGKKISIANIRKAIKAVN